MTQKVDFWLLLGVFHGLLQKMAKVVSKRVTLETLKFQRLSHTKQKKWLYRGMLYRNYIKIYNSNRMLQKM